MRSTQLIALLVPLFVSFVLSTHALSTRVLPTDGIPAVFETRAIVTTDVAGVMTCEVTFHAEVQDHRSLNRSDHRHVIASSSPLIREESHTHGEAEEWIEELSGKNSAPVLYRVFSRDQEAIEAHLQAKCDRIYESKPGQQNVEADEIISLVKSGDPQNRIDIVLMGDGYTLQERNKFVTDMTRMVTDMFRDVTFASYLPLFNIWALFRASSQSGIGVNGVPLKTAFGLYRDGTELRGIYCSKPQDARSACSGVGPYGCDFPSLIGNDAFYGGLGGEFTISTSSNTSGTIVLRHEMGHNFGNVGEEYDGGSVYSGANSATSLAVAAQKWSSWLTNPTTPPVAMQSVQRLQSYAWYDLAKGPLKLTFTSDGQWNRAYLIFSASGCETPGALTITLDGVPLAWKATGSLDRQFYPYIWNIGFSAGTHVLQFVGTKPSVKQIRQVCNVNLHEYKNETFFKFENSYVGAYSTWSESNRLTYRPTNERCLMRNMTSDRFCPVCQENNWLQFLNRMALIDAVQITDLPNDVVQVDLEVVPLAQFRPVPVPGEKYSVTWTYNNVVQEQLQDSFSFTMPASRARGQWVVAVHFQTLEVRYDPNKRLHAKVQFAI